MMKIFVYFFLITATVSAQKFSALELFDKVEKSYKKVNYYSYIAKYSFFENSASTKVIEEKTGRILKIDKVSYQNMDNIESLNFGDYSMVIDNRARRLSMQTVKNNFNIMSFKYYMDAFDQTKVMDGVKYWICELSSPRSVTSQYSTVKFYIRKDDFSLFKQVFSVKGKQEIVKNKKKIMLSNPRLEIELIEKQKNFKEDTKLVLRENYFTITNKKLTLSKRLKAYKITSL